MRHRVIKLGPVVGLLLASASQVCASDARLLTLNESIRIALENSPAYQSAAHQLRGAQARQKEARTGFFPRFGLESSYTRLNRPPYIDVPADFIGTPLEITIGSEHIYDAKLTAQQPIFTGFRIARAYQMAALGGKAAAAQLEASRQALVLDVNASYYGVLMAQEMLKVADSAVTQIEAHLSDVRNMYNAGLVARNDVLKAEVQQSNVALMQIQARNAVRMARIAFLNVLGLPLDEEVQLEDNLVYVPTDMDLDTAVQTALDTRPELRSTECAVDISRNAVRVAQAGWYPTLAGYYTYEYKSDQVDNPFKAPEPDARWQDNWEETWVAGLVLSFNLWDWGQTHYQAAQAKAEYAQALNGLTQLTNAVRLEVTQSYFALKEAEEKIAAGRKAVEQAEENLRVAEEKFDAEIVTNTDLLDAQTALTQARVGYVQALTDHLIAHARLKRSMGTLSR